MRFAIIIAAALAACQQHEPRVVHCGNRDGRVGHYTMPEHDIIPTPDGWVLYFPDRPRGQRAEVWDFCEVGQ